MSEPAIRVEGLGKRYRIGARESDRTFREAIVDVAAGPLRRLKSFGRSSHREEDSIWALKNVSFEVRPGEVAGVIGANGAGKTTLLKVLSRITEPTEGRVRIRGRTASLLEVGTGFHRELTGRENIYLSGAILGMTKREIENKFDEIVDFSGMDRFIDTPVKRYSSGMQVRLAFAVAAHLEPEILLIDEVLAVGDHRFRRKCLGKMDDVARSGRTILFVSHNMAAVQNLCKRGLLLDGGRLKVQGEMSQVVRHYLSEGLKPSAEVDLTSCRARRRGATPLLRRLWLLNADYRPASAFFVGEDINIALELHCPQTMHDPLLGIGFNSATGQRVTTVGSFQGGRLPPLRGRCFVICTVPRNRFAPGEYLMDLDLRIESNVAVDRVESVGNFTIEPADIYGTGWMPKPQQGVFLCESTFRVEDSPEAFLNG